MVFFSPFFKCLQGRYLQLNHSPWAPSVVKEGNRDFDLSPNRGGFVTYLYCCLESHLPAFVSRSLVARTLIILIKRIKFTWKREKQQQWITVRGDEANAHVAQSVLPPRWVKGLVSELEVFLLWQGWAALGKTQRVVGLHQPCLTRMVEREGNGILWERVGIQIKTLTPELASLGCLVHETLMEKRCEIGRDWKTARRWWVDTWQVYITSVFKAAVTRHFKVWTAVSSQCFSHHLYYLAYLTVQWYGSFLWPNKPLKLSLGSREQSEIQLYCPLQPTWC